MAVWWIVAAAANAEEARTNAFHDPFGPATQGMAGCPVPAGPLKTADEARSEAHWRVERGTSCFRSGRCRLPNAYSYDGEIHPRAVKFIRSDGRFDDTSVWVTVERRWVTLQGCVHDAAQAGALEAAVRLIDDVEAVIPQLMVGTRSAAPYEVAGAPRPGGKRDESGRGR